MSEKPKGQLNAQMTGQMTGPKASSSRWSTPA